MAPSKLPRTMTTATAGPNGISECAKENDFRDYVNSMLWNQILVYKKKRLCDQ